MRRESTFLEGVGHLVGTNLSGENEFGELFRINPAELVDDGQCREHPKTIANLGIIQKLSIVRGECETWTNVFLFLRPPVKASV